MARIGRATTLQGVLGHRNIFNHPLSFTHDGGEVIFNLPNGLQGYYLVNASGSRLDAAPINIVSNPAASDPTVRNGLSCFGCHTEGMKTFEDQVRSVIQSSTTPNAQALRLYVEQSEMDVLLREDMERYRVALAATGGAFRDIEPISRFHEAFQGEVNAAYAAAVVGLETEVFLEKIRENVGLQNAGLLVLEGENGSMKRDAWTDSFGDIIFALDFPENFTPPTDTTPTIPGAVVRIPDLNLRAVIAETLGKNTNVPITTEDMKKLTGLEARERDIQDLTGIQFATNLNHLDIRRNQISDLSPLAGLTKLREINIDRNPISNSIQHIKNLTSLVSITCTQANLSDLSPLTGLTNLEAIHGWGNPISDLSPLAGLTKLKHIYLPRGHISDLTPLSNLTELEELYLHDNEISDLSPLANLTKLKWLSLSGNKISDVSPLTNLTNLKGIGLHHNNISDISPLDGIRQNILLAWHQNPSYPKADPNIEGPWLWLILPNEEFDLDLDRIQKASKGKLTETKIATTGATEGASIGDQTWTAHKLSDEKELSTILKQTTHNAVIYGTISLHSPHKQETTMFVNNNNGLKVYLNKEIVYKQETTWKVARKYRDFFPITLKKGRNILLVAITNEEVDDRFHFSFKPGTEYTVANPGVGYTFSQTPIYTGDTFTLDIRAENVFDLAGWQFDIAFDPAALEAIDVSESGFLKSDGGTTFFHGGSIDNAAGKITGLSAARLSAEGVTGAGTILQVRFKAKSGGETELGLQNFQFGSVGGDSIPAGPHQIRIVVEGRLATGDVNRDGVVSILDLILVAQQLGKRVPAGSPVDVNGDGVVSILDLIRIAQGIGNTTASAAPSTPSLGPTMSLTPSLAGGKGGVESVDAAMVAAWIAQARSEDDGSLAFKEGIKNLENLLASLIPEETALLANYPNPFNPETWIPYQLAESAEVTLTIYDMNGGLVRRLVMGHQAAGMYRNRSRAAYWDGRNRLGESVASGLYFYTLTADEFTATRRMLILK